LGSGGGRAGRLEFIWQGGEDRAVGMKVISRSSVRKDAGRVSKLIHCRI